MSTLFQVSNNAYYMQTYKLFYILFNRLKISDYCVHIFAGKGIPNIRTQEKNRVAKVPARIVLNPDEAISRYHAMGGQLTLVPVFGADPLSPSHKIIRQQEFSRKYPDSQQIFQAAANGDESLFRDGLKYFMSITKRIARSTTLDQ